MRVTYGDPLRAEYCKAFSKDRAGQVSESLISVGKVAKLEQDLAALPIEKRSFLSKEFVHEMKRRREEHEKAEREGESDEPRKGSK